MFFLYEKCKALVLMQQFVNMTLGFRWLGLTEGGGEGEVGERQAD